jgi:uncharacterized RDD family membrane protein YckC
MLNILLWFRMPPEKSSSSGASAKPVAVELASLRHRLASMVYELLLLLGVLAAGFLLPWAILSALLDLKDAPAWAGGLELLYLFALLGVYFVYHWRHGQTLAMRTWHLQVVTAGGSLLSWKRASLRYALAWPSALCFGAGIFWAFFDLDNLFLHDRLAGTRVVSLSKR